MEQYEIYARYYYYSGTLHAPANHVMDLSWSYEYKPSRFPSREAAKQALEDYVGELDQLADNTYDKAGLYVLHHGEYERPKYVIRKVREARGSGRTAEHTSYH